MILSVIICAHNPRPDYLKRVLDALKAQTLPKEQWELLLIDNASREPLAGKWDLSWHPHSKIILEEELGLTPARLRGIRETRGELLVFVDDDNVLMPDYLSLAQRLSEKYPQLGCLGAGEIEPEFEEQPAAELMPYTSALALRTVGKTQWSNVPTDENIPWGAGLVARREVALEFQKSISQYGKLPYLGRKGQHLNGGEDVEFTWVACENGYGKGNFAELKVLHLIARQRVQRDYLLRIVEGSAFSYAILRHVHGKPLGIPEEDAPSFFKVLRAALLVRIATFFQQGQRWWKYRHTSEVEKAFANANYQGFKRAGEMLTKSGVSK